MKEIKIGYFADGPWAHLALKKILADKSIIISFICLRYETRDQTLKKIGIENKIDVIWHKNINSDEFMNIIEKYKIDLIVSMSFNQIFKKRIINYPNLGIINCHAGKLPFYRGRNILNWALINDEKEFGITVHYVDEGIDTGDIILQECYPISDEDNYSTLLEKSYIGCAELLYKAITQITKGTAKRIKQESIDRVGMYCGMRVEGDEIINWNQNSRKLFNFIRAITKPGPGALTYLNSKPLIIFNSKLVEGAHNYINTPGQILKKTTNSFIVKTLDSILEITDYVYDGKIRVGDRLKGQ